MEFGVCTAAKIDEPEYLELIETLGYSHLWVADSQMLWSDCYAVMTLAALRTKRIKIGTGVAVAGTRPAAVTAAAHATINRIAPGRVFCGIGTGNTAMRIMGHKPISTGEFDDYLRTLRQLLDGHPSDVNWRGQTSRTRHLMPDMGFVDFEHRMPLYVSAFGPKATAVAAKHADGLVVSIPPDPGSVRSVRARYEDHARAAGRPVNGPETKVPFMLSTLTTVFVLAEGEAVDSPRAREGCGAFAIVGLHYAYEQWRQYGRRPNKVFAEVWDDYVAAVEETPEEERHLRIHAGHNCWVLPSEERFLTPDVINATCLVGTAPQLVDRLRELEDAGLTQVMLLPPLAAKEQVISDVAAKVMPAFANGAQVTPA